MRTTLSLEDDAVEAIQAYAKANHVSLGKAASDLVLRGTRFQLSTKKVNGLPVFDAPDDFPLVTAAQVRDLLDEE